jgi:hypothetical protein
MNTKPFLIAVGIAFGLVIFGSIVGGVLQSKFKITIDQVDPTWIMAIKLFYLLLFLVIGFALVPVALNYFITMQIKIGNEDFVLIKWLATNAPQVVYGLWALFIVGLCIALPAAIKGGFFK